MPIRWNDVLSSVEERNWTIQDAWGLIVRTNPSPPGQIQECRAARDESRGWTGCVKAQLA